MDGTGPWSRPEADFFIRIELLDSATRTLIT
jgi:hypothetical protein